MDIIKDILIKYKGRLYPVATLIERARGYASKLSAICNALQKYAFDNHNTEIFNECQEIMMLANNYRTSNTNPDYEHAGDKNNLPAEAPQGAYLQKPLTRGRPLAKDFDEYLLDSTPKEFMPVMEKMLKGKTGKDAARIIVAITDVWIEQPAIASVCKRFPGVKSSSFSDALNKHYGLGKYVGNAKTFSVNELNNIRSNIKKLLSPNSDK